MIEDDLLIRVDNFVAKTGIPVTTVSKRATRASDFIRQLRMGNASIRTCNKLITWLDEHEVYYDVTWPVPSQGTVTGDSLPSEEGEGR